MIKDVKLTDSEQVFMWWQSMLDLIIFSVGSKLSIRVPDLLRKFQLEVVPVEFLGFYREFSFTDKKKT